MEGRGVKKIQKTVRLSKPLFEEVEHLVGCCAKRESVNDFIVKSLKLRISLLKRRELDAKFAEISNDIDYQKDAQLIMEEFECSDGETAKLLEE
jgi:hypothetical protein